MTRITSACSLAEYIEPPARCRMAVGNSARDTKVDLRTGAWSTPDVESAGHLSRAFAHALQTVMAGAAFFQCSVMDALAVVPNAHAKCPLAVDDFSLDAPGSSVTERVSEGFTRDSVHFVAKNRVQISGRAFDHEMKFRRILRR